MDGEEVTKYIASNNCTSEGSSYICEANSSGYIIDAPVFDLNEPNFFRPNLLGGRVEWDVDLSAHECGCVNSFYLVYAPAKAEDGSLERTDGYFYCDANAVGGVLCPEFDL